jgi:hypothetical protein
MRDKPQSKKSGKKQIEIIAKASPSHHSRKQSFKSQKTNTLNLDNNDSADQIKQGSPDTVMTSFADKDDDKNKQNTILREQE